MRWTLPLAAAVILLSAACSGIESLGDAGPALTGAERDSVRTQVDKALAEKQYKTAWNQEVAAGSDRARLEAIALEALENRSRHAEDMFAALRTKWGALGAQSRGKVDALVSAARSQDEWTRALDIELITADDPPAFSKAWAVYRAAPAGRAPGLLETIQETKAELAEAKSAENGG